MRGTARCLFMSLVVTLAVVGCNSAKKKAEAELAAQESYIPPAETTYGGTPSYPSYGTPAATETAYPAGGLETGSSPRYHTVVRHDTLYSLARAYYGDQRRWKDIYEANRSTISDPNKIRVGQRLMIP